MWYPTVTRLPGNRMLVNGGLARWTSILDSNRWKYTNRSVTVFDPAAFDREQQPWSIFVKHEDAPLEITADVFDYPHAFLLPSAVMFGGHPRHVAIYGGGQIVTDPPRPFTPGITLMSLDPTLAGADKFARPAHAARPEGGLSTTTAVMLSDGRILIMGGGSNGRAEGQRIDIYDPQTDSWRSTDTGVSRDKPSGTILPDGAVLIINGEDFGAPGNNIGDRRRPTLYDPRTDKVVNLKDSQESSTRGYHAISLLLKDGRVLVGGGRIYSEAPADVPGASGQEGPYRIGCEQPELRIFSPPYLFGGPRPVIAENMPQEIVAGGAEFHLDYSGAHLNAAENVVLMALGAYTHSFDQNQRRVVLASRTTTPGKLTVSPPGDTWIAPEGDYNLFLISDKGVPSLGRSVRVVRPRI
jgi:hypothetical protein